MTLRRFAPPRGWEEAVDPRSSTPHDRLSYQIHLLYYQQDTAKWQTASIAPIHVKFGRGYRHIGPLGRMKFHLNQCMGWECSPKS